MNCKCIDLTRASSKVATKHHPNCPDYDPEGDAKIIINDLLDGIMAWASDEDGVHHDCWDTFKSAAHFVYRSEIINNREPE